MKAASSTYTGETSANARPERPRRGAAWIKAALVFAVLACIYATFGWAPLEPPNANLELGLGFIAFWVLGAAFTIGFIALSGRRSS